MDRVEGYQKEVKNKALIYNKGFRYTVLAVCFYQDVPEHDPFTHSYLRTTNWEIVQ